VGLMRRNQAVDAGEPAPVSATPGV
jgi:hypothetical protein